MGAVFLLSPDYEGSDVVNQIWDQYFDHSLHHKERLDEGIGILNIVRQFCGGLVVTSRAPA